MNLCLQAERGLSLANTIGRKEETFLYSRTFVKTRVLFYQLKCKGAATGSFGSSVTQCNQMKESTKKNVKVWIQDLCISDRTELCNSDRSNPCPPVVGRIIGQRQTGVLLTLASFLMCCACVEFVNALFSPNERKYHEIVQSFYFAWEQGCTVIQNQMQSSQCFLQHRKNEDKFERQEQRHDARQVQQAVVCQSYTCSSVYLWR